MAIMSLSNREDALDAVQEAMLQLVRRYSDKPEAEWRPLFYRILQNKINDTHRRNNVRNRFKGWLPTFRDNKDGSSETTDPIQSAPAPKSASPEFRLEQRQDIEQLQQAIRSLPARQQQAFVLRCWEGLSTRETALSMQCSEGSVKTHYSRALHTLREQMQTGAFD